MLNVLLISVHYKYGPINYRPLAPPTHIEVSALAAANQTIYMYWWHKTAILKVRNKLQVIPDPIHTSF